jgi:alpha-ketoglutarate-dependent taurine dioxygenase
MPGINPPVDLWPTGRVRKGWYGSELGTPDFVTRVEARQLDAIKALIREINDSGKPVAEIRKVDLSHRHVDPLFDQIGREVRHGKGLLILTGLSDLAEPDLRILHWGIGTHLGTALSQSHRGELVVHVTSKQGSDRGSGGTAELVMHTDPGEIIILLAVRKAKAGGVSRFCSSLAAWDEMQSRRPDLAQILQEGFRCWRYGEQAPGDDEYTPYNVPVFSECEGLRSVVYARQTIERAHADLKIGLSLNQIVALNMFDSIVADPRLRFEIMLEPGDLAIMNNYEVLHSRSSYDDHYEWEKRRLLLRLWIESPAPRPLQWQALKFQNKSGRQGIDPW